jgi:hypothetical protein
MFADGFIVEMGCLKVGKMACGAAGGLAVISRRRVGRVASGESGMCCCCQRERRAQEECSTKPEPKHSRKETTVKWIRMRHCSASPTGL